MKEEQVLLSSLRLNIVHWQAHIAIRVSSHSVCNEERELRDKQEDIKQYDVCGPFHCNVIDFKVGEEKTDQLCNSI